MNRGLLSRIAWVCALVGLAIGGESVAQGAKEATAEAPAAGDAAGLLEQANAAYDAKDYPAALVAARRSAELAPGKDSVLAYQIWLLSAEQVGDLGGMAAALEAYAAVPGLGKSSVAMINKARPRLEFYQAEQAGRVDDATAALGRVRKAGAPDAAWLKQAERRLALRNQLVQGELDGLLTLTAAPTDSLGQQSWVRAVRGEAVGLAAVAACAHADGLAAVGDALAVPHRTPEELRRLSALEVRLRTEQAIFTPGQGDPVLLSKGLEPLGELSPEERVWLARVAMRADLDGDWVAGRYGEVLDLREHYRNLMAQPPAEPACLAPAVWLDADEAEFRAKEADTARRRAEEEATRRQKRPSSEGPTAQQKRVSTWLFVGAGASVLAAGGLGMLASSTSAEFSGSEEPFAAWDAREQGLYRLNHAGAIGAATGLAGALALSTVGFTVRW